MSKVLSEYNFDQALSRTPKASQTHGKSEKLLLIWSRLKRKCKAFPREFWNECLRRLISVYKRLATVSSSSPDVYGPTLLTQSPPTRGLAIPSPCMDLINMLWFPAATAEVRGTPPHQILVLLSTSLCICLHSHVTVSQGSGTQVSRVAAIWVHCPKKTYYSHNTILKAQETQHSG